MHEETQRSQYSTLWDTVDYIIPIRCNFLQGQFVFSGSETSQSRTAFYHLYHNGLAYRVAFGVVLDHMP